MWVWFLSVLMNLVFGVRSKGASFVYINFY